MNKKISGTIKQGNWHQSIIALRCHRSSLLAFDECAAKCISFIYYALQRLLLLRFIDAFSKKVFISNLSF
jgi:hypothetical protein